MTTPSLRHLLAVVRRPPRSLAVLLVEVAGLAGIVYGIHGWTASGAWVAAGIGLVLEAYALEQRRSAP